MTIVQEWYIFDPRAQAGPFWHIWIFLLFNKASPQKSWTVSLSANDGVLKLSARLDQVYSKILQYNKEEN